MTSTHTPARNSADRHDARGHAGPRHTVRRWLLPLVLLPAFTVACSSEAIGDAAAEKIAEAGAGGDADVNIDSESGDVSVETEDGTFSASTGSAELPDGWPADLPLPEDYSLTAATSFDTDDGTSFTIGGDVEDGLATFEEVTAAFTEGGWTELQKSTMDTGEGTSSSATYENSSHQVVFSTMGLDEGINTFAYTVIPATP